MKEIGSLELMEGIYLELKKIRKLLEAEAPQEQNEGVRPKIRVHRSGLGQSEEVSEAKSSGRVDLSHVSRLLS